MIPFDDLVAALERFKQRKQSGGAAPTAPTSGPTSGKQQAGVRQVSLTDLATDDLIHED
jgi:hypothetical protein